MNMQLRNKRKLWYSNRNVQFELLKLMKNREVCFIDIENPSHVIRGLRIRSIKYLNDTFKNFNFFDKNYNIYISVAKYDSIPNFTLNLSKRSKETSEWFENEAINSITEYDILHDFDSKKIQNYMKMKQEIEKLLFLYEANNVTYSIYPSGNNFQIIIPGNIIDLPLKVSKNIHKTDNKNGYSRYYLSTLKTRLILNFLDFNGIGVFNKIRKLPYSLYNDRVIIPLDFIHFKNTFTYEDTDSNLILKTFKLGFRGHKFMNDFGIQINQKNFRLFKQKYFID